MSLLARSHDRKVANFVNKAGTQSAIQNAFGLPSGTNFSCPGATSVCSKVCYAGKLEKIYSGVSGVVLRNWDLVKDADYSTMVSLLSEMINEFVADCDKRAAEKAFRIHWDGDFFNLDYAMAWATVIKQNPDVQFWAYTRSFTDKLNVVPMLANIDNLSLYLSVDNDNSHFVSEIISAYPAVRIAMLADTMKNAGTAMNEFRNRPGAKCPEQIKSIPLISTNGGACFSCGLCVKGKADIRFSISKK